MNKTIATTCSYCEASIERQTHRGHGEFYFCDPICRAAWVSANRSGINDPRWSRMQVKCASCGKDFYRKRGQVKKVNYCTRQCSAVGHRGVNNPNYSDKQTFPCSTCGNPVVRPPNQANAINYFCNAECYGIWKRVQKGTSSHNWKSQSVECAQCGQVFDLPPSRLERATNYFCSLECKDAYLRGKQHPLWKGGTLSYGPNWTQQSRAARKRDNYACQHCGKQQHWPFRALDVHHIRPFRDFGYLPDENDNYLQANQLTNLITLCHRCHVNAELGKIVIQCKLL